MMESADAVGPAQGSGTGGAAWCGHIMRGECQGTHLACIPPGCPLDRAVPCGWSIRRHQVPFWGLSALTLFWGQCISCGKGEKGVLSLVQVMQTLVSGSWTISGEPVRTA